MTPDRDAAIVEAVAQALYAERWAGYSEADWPGLSHECREAWLLSARTAIAAHIRALEAAGYAVAPMEPTVKMVDAGRRSVSTWLGLGHGVEAQRNKYAIRWRAMIAARTTLGEDQ